MGGSFIYFSSFGMKMDDYESVEPKLMDAMLKQLVPKCSALLRFLECR